LKKKKENFELPKNFKKKYNQIFFPLIDGTHMGQQPVK
jgi:hypothetical protein